MRGEAAREADGSMATAQGDGGFLVIGDDVVGVQDRRGLAQLAHFPEQGLDLSACADQQEMHIWMALTGNICATKHHRRRVVAPHHVKSKCKALSQEIRLPSLKFGKNI